TQRFLSFLLPIGCKGFHATKGVRTIEEGEGSSGACERKNAVHGQEKREAIQGASHLSNEIRVLRCFSLSLGFEYLLVTPNVYFDLLGLSFRLLGEIYVQHALVIVGAHLGGIH